MKHSGLSSIVSAVIAGACLSLFCVSCTQQIVIKRVKQAGSFTELKELLDGIHDIAGLATIRFKTPEKTQEGTASIRLDTEGFDVRIYSMGILTSELSEKNGAITSEPDIGNEAKRAFAVAIREGLLWWQTSEESKIEETGDKILIKAPDYIATIDARTLEPIEKTVFLKEGSIIRIVYGDTQSASSLTDDVLLPYKITATIENEELSIIFDKIELNKKTGHEKGTSGY
jgi:hypothetical protein